MDELIEALIVYLESQPAACEIRASVSKNSAGIESVNVFVTDEGGNRIDKAWQEFRQDNKESDVATG